MTKDCKYFTSAQSIKFNKTQIKFDLDSIVLIKKNNISGILLVIMYNANFTSSKSIIAIKLLPKK